MLVGDLAAGGSVLWGNGGAPGDSATRRDGIGADGVSQLLGSIESAPRGHCATADDRGNVWICDATAGRLLRFADPYPATP